MLILHNHQNTNEKKILSYKIYMYNYDSKHVRAFQCRANKFPYNDFTIICEEETK